MSVTRLFVHPNGCGFISTGPAVIQRPSYAQCQYDNDRYVVSGANRSINAALTTPPKALLSYCVCAIRSLIMRPSSLGGGRILRRTLSVRLSVCPSVPCVFTLEPSYERTSKIKLPFSIIGQRQPCGRVVSFVLFTFAGRIL